MLKSEERSIFKPLRICVVLDKIHPMKLKVVYLLLPIVIFGFKANAQESGELAGDHFSLQGALDLFRSSISLEEFEKKINSDDSGVNNLDLNEDGDVDYVRVEDYGDEDVRSFVLQVQLSEDEKQDIAVIGIEKTGEESAVIQIIGNESIYGNEVILEPNSDAITGGKGSSTIDNLGDIVINVWAWPLVRFVYGHHYTPFRSNFHFGFYPTWYKPWKVRAWSAHWSRCHVYHARYSVVYVHRVGRAHAFYKTKRVNSVRVEARYKSANEKHRMNKSAGAPVNDKNNKAVEKNKAKTPKANKPAKQNAAKAKDKSRAGSPGRGGKKN
jgi:hypothetical protein